MSDNDDSEANDVAGYGSLDDLFLSAACVKMRLAAEKEVLRHSWLDGQPYLPAALYASVEARTVASAVEGCLGDWTAARARLSDEAWRWLAQLMGSPPSRSLDWCMRAISLCLSQEPSIERQAPPSIPNRRRRRNPQRVGKR